MPMMTSIANDDTAERAENTVALKYLSFRIDYGDGGSAFAELERGLLLLASLLKNDFDWDCIVISVKPI